MSSRRYFIKNTTQLFLGTACGDWVNASCASNLSTVMNEQQESDWEAIRNAFSLQKTRTYFNSGTLGPSPKVVTQAVIKAMQKTDETGEMAHSIVEPRKALARFVKANPAEIALTKNTTEGINIIAQGIDLVENDEVIISNHEHVGNATPWLNVAYQKKLILRVVSLGYTDEETLSNIKNNITPQTKLIVMPHIACTTGQVQPVQRISALGHSKGIPVFIDGAHTLGMLDLDLPSLGCDYYATCCHKWLLGPKGTGFLYVKKDKITSIKSLYVGAGTHSNWILSPESQFISDYVPTAARFDYGTYNIAIWEGVEAAIHFMESIGMTRIENRIKELNKYLQVGLQSIGADKLSILTPLSDTTVAGMIGIKLKTKDTKSFIDFAALKFRLRFVAEHNLNSIRISTHIFNNKKEIDDLVACLREYLT